MKSLVSKGWLPPLLLLMSIAIGAGLRFTQLAGKSPWTDEFATLVFSLGNSFKTVPLNEAIPLNLLMQPLQPDPAAGASAVLRHLFAEDHHPPLYFVLVHWWMQLFPQSGYVSLWAARSLPALFGVISIPALYGLSWLAFRSQLVAQLAAALMAVSPYGIFLAQEARHYTLAVLWVIASLCCLVVAAQHLQRRRPLPMWIVLSWVVVNSLGIATHYFFTLTLCAEIIVLLVLWWRQRREMGSEGAREQGSRGAGEQIYSNVPASKYPVKRNSHRQSSWWRIYAAVAGTVVGGLIWFPVLQSSYDPQMTAWIQSSDRNFLEWLNPLFQSLAAWITMLALLPVEAASLPVVIVSGALMIAFFVWAIPLLYRGIRVQLQQPSTRLGVGVLGGFILGAIAIFFAITYFLGTDLTRGARYNFVYFPGVIAVLGASLAVSWKATHSQLTWGLNGKKAIALIGFVGLLSGITVVSNLGYQKYYRPDLLVSVMQRASSHPVLIATTHNTLVQTGEIMGIAWELQHAANAQKALLNPQFLLAHQKQGRCEETNCPAVAILQDTLAQLPRPLDLWLVNFKAPVVEAPNCFAEEASILKTPVDGYDYQLYRCL